MRTNPLHAVTVVCLVVASSGCGGDDAPAGAERDAPAGGAAVEADSAATITISNFSFDGVTEVAVGTTVVVTNLDNSPHTWTALDGSFDSGALGQDESFEFTFSEPGAFAYQCNFHPSMTGTVVVTG